MEQEPKTDREREEDLISLLVPAWRPTSWQGLWAVRIGIVLGLLGAIGYSYGVTLWDWIKLLVVPAVIAAVGLWFNRQQQERALEVESQRAQDQTLHAYLDEIGQLLLDEDRPLRQSQKGSEVRILPRARTLTALTRLDGNRKRSVLQFLYEAGLISKENSKLPGKFGGVVDLRGADLKEVNLREVNLREVNLREVDLSRADLSHADLSGVLIGEGHLRSAKLSGANLKEADLSGANLWWGNLSEAVGLTDEQIAAADSLDDTTMPNGQKYEEWIKSREEDG